MTNQHDPHRLEEEPQSTSHPVSFVMRCWVGRGEVVRARVTDVRSGVSYPLADRRSCRRWCSVSCWTHPHLTRQWNRRLGFYPSISG